MTIDKWTNEAQERLREQVKGIIQTEKLKQTQIAAEAGIPYGTFTAWLGGTYAGVTADKADTVAKWLETRAQKRQLAQKLPDAPRFQETETASRLLALLNYCQNAPDLGVVATGAGVGKTTACEEYRRRASNVYIVTAEPVMTSPATFLMDLAGVLDLPEMSPVKLSSSIVRKLRGANALIIVDEAQHLSTTTLNQARSLHDRAQCGLVFVGNETVYSRMGNGRAEFAQLFSRVGIKHTQARPQEADVITLVKAWGVDLDPSLPLSIARKPGALRGLTKALRLAHVLAASSSEPVTSAHLMQAWKHIGFDAAVEGA